MRRLLLIAVGACILAFSACDKKEETGGSKTLTPRMANTKGLDKGAPKP
jgi:hypothetical protein